MNKLKSTYIALATSIALTGLQADIANISTRALIDPANGGDSFILSGIVITDTPQRVLVRAAGPSLQGVNGVSDPGLLLVDVEGNILGELDDWQSAPNSFAAALTGFAPSDPAEAAYLTTLDPGAYAVQANANEAGFVLLEVYDTPLQTIAQGVGNAADSGADFTILNTALTATGLDAALAGEGPFTLFAPTDAAFAALPEGTLDTLLGEPGLATLTDILLLHVIGSQIASTDLVAGDNVAPSLLDGSDLTVNVGDGVTVNGSNVIETDAFGTNGVIHIIDTVILP